LISDTLLSRLDENRWLPKALIEMFEWNGWFNYSTSVRKQEYHDISEHWSPFNCVTLDAWHKVSRTHILYPICRLYPLVYMRWASRRF